MNNQDRNLSVFWYLQVWFLLGNHKYTMDNAHFEPPTVPGTLTTSQEGSWFTPFLLGTGSWPNWPIHLTALDSPWLTIVHSPLDIRLGHSGFARRFVVSGPWNSLDGLLWCNWTSWTVLWQMAALYTFLVPQHSKLVLTKLEATNLGSPDIHWVS